VTEKGTCDPNPLRRGKRFRVTDGIWVQESLHESGWGTTLKALNLSDRGQRKTLSLKGEKNAPLGVGDGGGCNVQPV